MGWGGVGAEGLNRAREKQGFDGRDLSSNQQCGRDLLSLLLVRFPKAMILRSHLPGMLITAWLHPFELDPTPFSDHFPLQHKQAG